MLLEVEGLVKSYSQHRRPWQPAGPAQRAVDDVSFQVEAGQTLALVGESGSGKSTTARCVARLIQPTAGTIRFDGVDISGLKRAQMFELRRRMQIIFQDPKASFDPRRRIGRSIREPLRIHGVPTSEQHARVRPLLELVGLNQDHERVFPHQLSGGQLQRAAIVRALTLEPRLLICDEPVSALDVSVQAQIIALLRRLQAELGVAYLFIAHDLAVVGELANRIAVMRHGKIVELDDARRVLTAPSHPYAQQLLGAVLSVHRRPSGSDRVTAADH